MDFKARLQQSLLSAIEMEKVPSNIEVVCGVLLPLCVSQDTKNVEILMTKRTSKVLTHKSQISFPGGVKEPEDTDILQTALREAQEEVGLNPKHVEILGRLPAVTTHTTGLLIYPFVGLITLPYTFKISEDEVDKILMIPLEKILKEGLPPLMVEIEGFSINSIGFHHENELIWGASARMLADLRSALEPFSD